MKTIEIRPITLDDIEIIGYSSLFISIPKIKLKSDLAYNFTNSTELEKLYNERVKTLKQIDSSEKTISQVYVDSFNAFYPHKIAITDSPFVQHPVIMGYIEKAVSGLSHINEPIDINFDKSLYQNLVGNDYSFDLEKELNESDFLSKFTQDYGTSFKSIFDMSDIKDAINNKKSDYKLIFGDKINFDLKNLDNALDDVSKMLNGVMNDLDKELKSEQHAETLTDEQIKMMDVLTGKLSIPYSLAKEMVVDRQYTAEEILDLVTKAYNKGRNDAIIEQKKTDII